MSAAVRAELAAAASAVTGISCEPYYRQATKEGAAHVRLDRTEFPNRLGGVCYWQVIVMLPQSLATAEKFIDTKTLALQEALRGVLVVTAVTPQQMVFEAGTAAKPVLIVDGHRAQEE